MTALPHIYLLYLLLFFLPRPADSLTRYHTMAAPRIAQRRKLKSVFRAQLHNIISNASLPPDPAGPSSQLHPSHRTGLPFKLDEIEWALDSDPDIPLDIDPNAAPVHAELAELWAEFDRNCGGTISEVAIPEKVEPRSVGVHTPGVNRRATPQSRKRRSAGQYSSLARMSMEWRKEGQRKRASAESGGGVDERAKGEDEGQDDKGVGGEVSEGEAVEDWAAALISRGTAPPMIEALKRRRKAVIEVFAQTGYIVGGKGGEKERSPDLGLRSREDCHLVYKSMSDSPARGEMASDLDLGLRSNFTNLVDKPASLEPHPQKRCVRDSPPHPGT